MEDLYKILKKQGYKKIRFKVSKTQHLLLKASINGIPGNFILDTGASTSCIGFESVARFSLSTKKSKTKASGAGGTGMLTEISMANMLNLGRWKNTDFHLVVFDMSHVNAALREHKARSVHGIIGADVLLAGEAIIDYAGGFLFLK